MLIQKELTGVPAKKDISAILLPRNFLLVGMTVEIVFISEHVIVMQQNVSKVLVYIKTPMVMAFQTIVKETLLLHRYANALLKICVRMHVTLLIH